jgi:uncharacterized repeat protein (TIGR03806 family)
VTRATLHVVTFLRPWTLVLAGAALGACTALLPLGCGGTTASSAADTGSPVANTDGGSSPFGLDVRVRPQTCVAPERPSLGSGVVLEEVFTRGTFAQPIDLAVAPGDAEAVYVAERAGRIRRAIRGATPSTFFAMPAGVIDAAGEGGFLGFAFHPRWAAGTREVIVSYTIRANPLRSIVARVRSTDGGATLDPTTLETILALDQPFTNHNGGGVRFGPDGFLYVGFGDGGAAGDPLNAGQRTDTWLGKFLRLDVDRRDPGRAYAIPPTNPFARGGGLPEIFALGFRNPWRWSFDTAAGDLWAGDVGQDRLEEIDLVTRGGNYGWKVREGDRCYPGGDDACTKLGLVDPVLAYPRGDGVSVTGGYVYRGARIPSLVGAYVFGDYASGNVWALVDDGRGARTKRLLARLPANELASFGQDARGEILLLRIGSGAIMGLAPAAPEPPSTFPQRLSQTGCVDPANPRLPAPSLVPYTPRAMLWSDGSTKERFVALPDDAKVEFGADGDFVFPRGTVLVKHFDNGPTRLETRLYVRHTDGVWAGYSYAWNDAQTDATLLPAGEVRTVRGVSWAYPSRSDCNRCHTEAAGFALGLEAAQLDHAVRFDATGRTANQLATWEHLGLFAAPLPDARATPLPDPFGAGDLEARARAYLHANCASCHRPEGGARGDLDLRATTPFSRTGLCEAKPQTDTLGIADARIVAPGKPESSTLVARMRATDGRRMPPLATRVVDEAGSALVEAWIRARPDCTDR